MNVVCSPHYEVGLGTHPWHTSKYRLALAILEERGLVEASRVLDAPMAPEPARVTVFESAFSEFLPP